MNLIHNCVANRFSHQFNSLCITEDVENWPERLLDVNAVKNNVVFRDVGCEIGDTSVIYPERVDVLRRVELLEDEHLGEIQRRLSLDDCITSCDMIIPFMPSV
ncbi:hypothetical protein DPMN_067134 [Dreissena polymorpha]|uniref:Uncharacterized protein n=1 Tax=Dreissena polymorpha TaxID=45954 RepID=A0A9D3YUR6_DREPO|nr:hypothetical protein DPMN_067134 [Dreissena polymorpha]